MKSQTSFELLLDWVEGHLSEQDSHTIVNRLTNATEATLDDLTWIKGFHQARQDILLGTPPPSVRNVLTDRFKAFAQERKPPILPASVHAFLQQFKALLTFDSQRGFITAGVRSATTSGQRRQLIFSTDMAEVALNILPQKQESAVNLTGQLFMLTDSEQEEDDSLLASVQLLQRESQVAITSTDNYGEFTFRELPIGEYEMIISSDEFEVLISPLPLLI